MATKDVFTITSSALPENTRVAGFRGAEGVSRLYEFELFLLVGEEGQDFELADAIGAKVKLELTQPDAEVPFVFHGILAAFELVLDVNGRSLFRATMVPQLWQLTQTLHSRIFTQMSIPDILKDVLEDGGLTSHDYVFKLAGQYKPEEHVCQYQESNLDFIARWMEREGMYYYFEQGDDGEKLIISDSKSFQKELSPNKVRFYALSGHDMSAGDSLSSFTCKHRALPARVQLNDYDYTKPTLDVSGGAAVSNVGLGEINVHGARFFTPDDGKRLAKIRAEELLAREVVFHGSGSAPHLRAGYLFELEDHPRAAFDQKYFATEVEHVGNQAISSPDLKRATGIESSEIYRVEVVAIPAKVQFRSRSLTAWPRIYGFENGTICGAAESEYAQIDDHGRYNVKFKFDESDLKNGKASTWVRMLQPHGGGIEGWHFPLRKGTEVLFTFLGGDPDRPVIAGVVPNAHTPSPVTKANHTTNVIQTGGRNRLELEDKAGQQRITLQTPHTNTMIRMGAPNDEHNLIVRTDGQTLLDVGGYWNITVGSFKTEDVQGYVQEHYHQTRETIVHGHADEKWEASLTSHVEEETSQTYKGPHEIKSESTRTEEIGGIAQETYKGATNRTYEQSLEEKVDGGTSIKYEGGLIWDIGANGWEADIVGKVDIKCAAWEVTQRDDVFWKCLTNKNEFTAGISKEQILGLKNEIIVGVDSAMLIGGKMEVTIGASMDLHVGPKFEANPAGKMEIKSLHLKSAALEAHETEAKMTAHSVAIMQCALSLSQAGLFVVP